MEINREWPFPPERMTTEIEADILHSITDQILDAMDLSNLEQWEEDNYEVVFPLNTELKFRVHYYKWDETDEDNLIQVEVMTEDFKNAEELKIAYRIIDGFYRTYDEYEANHEIVDIYQEKRDEKNMNKEIKTETIQTAKGPMTFEIPDLELYCENCETTNFIYADMEPPYKCDQCGTAL